MATTVVNIRTLPRNPADWPPSHVYVGRAMPRRRLPESPWANPFRIGTHGTRADVIARYEEWLLHDEHLIARLDELRDRVLVCWCAPEPCHADVLARLADAE